MISRLIILITVFGVAASITVFSAESPTDNSSADPYEFVHALKNIYLTDDAKANARVGIEIEMNTLSEETVKEILLAQFGGDSDSEFIRGSRIGDIRVYRDGPFWHYNDWMRDHNDGKENRWVRLFHAVQDNFKAAVEVAFPPIARSQLSEIEETVASFKARGATGSSYFSSTAIHPNIEIDPKNRALVMNLFRNYTVNEETLSRYINPSARRLKSGFIPSPCPDFLEKLLDPAYNPTPEEFWKDFMDGAHIKFSKMNIGPALLSDLDIGQSEKEKLIEAGWTKPRPTFELREPDSRFEPGYLTDMVDLGIALKQASLETGKLTFGFLQYKLAERHAALQNVKQILGKRGSQATETRARSSSDFERLKERRFLK